MRDKIKLESTAGTGHFYTTTKNKRTMTENAFSQWLFKAQELRDEALKTGIGNIDIEEYRRKLNDV